MNKLGLRPTAKIVSISVRDGDPIVTLEPIAPVASSGSKRKATGTAVIVADAKRQVTSGARVVIGARGPAGRSRRTNLKNEIFALLSTSALLGKDDTRLFAINKGSQPEWNERWRDLCGAHGTGINKATWMQLIDSSESGFWCDDERLQALLERLKNKYTPNAYSRRPELWAQRRGE